MAESVSDTSDVKFVLGILRFFEFAFAVTLTGVCAWFHDRAAAAHFYNLYKVDVPLGFSVAAIWISAMATITYIFHSAGSQVILGVLDWVLFGGYIASAVVYSQFSSKCNSNRLVVVIQSVGDTSCGTVRLAAAFIIIQILLFLCTAILSWHLASRLHATRAGPGAQDRGLFGSRKRSHDQSTVQSEATAAGA
ncbi:hypothetical protein TWF281_004776 [Arthrobotrys megalospora]